MSRGILLLAIGDKYYAELALNLILSIRASDEKIGITVHAYGEAYTELQKYNGSYTLVLLDRDDVFYNDKMQIGKLKCKLYDLSPYESTLFMDVDSLWNPLRKLSWICAEFEESDVDWTAQNTPPRGDKKWCIFWATEAQIQEGWPQIQTTHFSVHSYFMWWRKTEKAKKLFNTSLEVWYDLYERNKIPYIDWEGQIPDELCITIAAHLENMMPHRYPWTPLYVSRGEIPSAEDKQRYWGISLPNNTWDSGTTDWYLEQIGKLRKHKNLPKFIFREKNYFSKTPSKKIYIITSYDESPLAQIALQNNIANPRIEKILLINGQYNHSKVECISVHDSIQKIQHYCKRNISPQSIIIYTSPYIHFDEKLVLLEKHLYSPYMLFLLSSYVMEYKNDKMVYVSQPMPEYRHETLIWDNILDIDFPDIPYNQEGASAYIAYYMSYNRLIQNKQPVLLNNPSEFIKPICLDMDINKYMPKPGHRLEGDYALVYPSDSIWGTSKTIPVKVNDKAFNCN